MNYASQYPPGFSSGSLTVLSYPSPFRVECSCACGAVVTKRAQIFSTSRPPRYCSQSCPLLKSKQTLHKHPHGPHTRALYHVWHNMHGRCTSTGRKCHARYGGRGIRVCSEWAEFSAFARDMLPGYSPDLYLDRVDFDGDYCPSNCRWVTSSISARNTCRSLLLRVGAPLDAYDRAMSRGISISTYAARIRRGIPWERALVSGKTRTS